MRAKHTLWVSCLIVACAWLFLDLVVRDPWTALFIVIALGSDLLVRIATGGVFFDANAPVVSAVRMLVCVALFAGPGFVASWLSARLFSPRTTSIVIIGWLVCYLSALSFLFPPRFPGG